MGLFRTLLAALLIAVPHAASALCTADGAYGIEFGKKIGFFASRASEPGLHSPYLTSYSAPAKQPDPRFDAYRARVENDAKVIYAITALSKLFTAPTSMMPGDEYRARVYPVLAEMASQISKEQGVQMQAKNGGYYTAFTSDIGLLLSSEWDGQDVYATFTCLNMKLNHAAEQSAAKKLFDCIGDGSTYKPECPGSGQMISNQRFKPTAPPSAGPRLNLGVMHFGRGLLVVGLR